MELIYSIHDVETTINNSKLGNMEAFPFYDDNRVVENGVAFGSFESNDLSTSTTKITDKDERIFINSPRDKLIKLIVGHNWKFDLHYLMKHEAEVDGIPVREWVAKNHIWDTQSAEYILTSHYNKYPSLDECSEKYGGNLKDDRIKVLWGEGLPTENIIPEMLTEYLDEDLSNTNIVFRAQLKVAKASGHLPVIRAMNDAVLAYQEMEWNGMKINPTELFARRNFLHKKYDKLVNSIITKFIPEELIDHINIGASQQLSALLFGGTIKYEQKEKVGTYKNGNDKYKKIEYKVNNPLFDLREHANDEWKAKKEGIYLTNDNVLTALKFFVDHDSPEYYFISSLQDLRTLSKELSGYYDSIPSLLCPDCRVHQNINNTATSTGRLSESDPNLQNVPKRGKTRVKKMFVSRFGKDGVIMEADWKQLEVIALAFISGCPALRADILNGVDVHNETWKKIKHLMPKNMKADDQKRTVKTINFGMIYGGGAFTLSKNSGMPIKVVKAILRAFYDRYPGVKVWQDGLKDTLVIQKGTYGRTKEKNIPRQMGLMHSVTGRTYSFLTFDAPKWLKGRSTSFSPTQLKNYPIQGFATGDVVPTVIGVLYRKLLNNQRLKNLCLMVNTVHDSIIFDCHRSVLEEAFHLIKETTEGAPEILKKVYNIDFDLPLKVDITAGLNWKDQKQATEYLGVAS